MKEPNRCNWCLKDDLYIRYHDEEWGVPVYDDLKMFEFLILETFQAGLSWYTILKKRENFRQAFFQFDPEKMAKIDEKYYLKLMANEGIIRNQAKIRGAITNAKQFLKVVESGDTFCDYLWKFTDHKTINKKVKSTGNVPATTEQSDIMSKELKKAGFAFVGSTVCYAHMQATGMVNDHVTECFRHMEVQNIK
ncbi:MAG: DNA-3-methyladenine glycosylase I [Bacteroidetes bacterium]|nr:DNA-3-methyladenine glycosylase I [Bacteroidota bacterium]